MLLINHIRTEEVMENNQLEVNDTTDWKNNDIILQCKIM